jgi:hypothetical protein
MSGAAVGSNSGVRLGVKKKPYLVAAVDLLVLTEFLDTSRHLGTHPLNRDLPGRFGGDHAPEKPSIRGPL